MQVSGTKSRPFSLEQAVAARPTMGMMRDIGWPHEDDRRLVAAAFWFPFLLPALGALIGGIEARPFWNGPAEQHPVKLQAEVVVQVTRAVLLDHEAQGGALGLPHPAFRLGSDREIAFLAVELERHG